MQQYFFHFTDGQRVFRDSEGQKLSGLRAARAHATQQVRDLKAAMCDPAIQDLSAWSMIVCDAQERTVFVLGFDMKPRPQPAEMTAAPPARQAPSSRGL